MSDRRDVPRAARADAGTDRGRSGADTAGRALVAAVVAVAVLAAALVAWQAAGLLLVVFAGVLLALALRGLADVVAGFTPLGLRVAVLVVVLGIAGTAALAIWLLADDVAAQVNELARTLPRAFDYLRDRLAATGWGRFAAEQLPSLDQLVSGRMVARATGLLGTTVGATIGVVANVVIVLFLGLYLAIDPRSYARGLVRLVPPARRARARQVVDALGHTLRRWLVGKLIGMLVVGVLTGVGLWLVGLPLALTLGLLAGLLAFIPYIGPLVSFLPAFLLALMEGGTTVLWVAIVYVAVQTLESYLITPLVERRSVSLPPALTIAAQVLLGVLFGWPGLLLASPLAAAALVLVQMLYIEDVLGEHDVRGEPAAPASVRPA